MTVVVGMDRIAVLPDIRPTGFPAGYPVGAGYRIFQKYDELYEILASFYQNKSFKANKIEAKGQ